ncbi:MAG TPA: DUF192 domain-containing protein [Methanocella sp.]|nr:DUF192 domain-containing protein [Methanocella sp.]
MVKRQLLVTIMAVIFIALAIGGLILVMQQKGPERASTVDLVSDSGTVTHLDVEIADTPAEQEHGLMNRSALPEDAGMLFVFGDDQTRYFWMEDTLIPLDMIFIAKNLTIVDVHENATPLSRAIIASSSACRYVLEVNGGLCEAKGIEIGDRVTLDLD